MKLKLASKLTLPIIIGLVALAIIGFFIMDGIITRQGEALTSEAMLSIIDGAEETREAYAALYKDHAFDMAALKAELASVGLGNFRSSILYRTVPIVAAWKNASYTAEKKGFQFRVVRDNPRVPANSPTPAESLILRALEKPGVKQVVEIDNKNGWLVAARPIILTADCLACHGDPSTSPTGDGKDVLGYRMENWKAGAFGGAFILTSPLAPIRETAFGATLTTAAWLAPVFVIIMLGMVVFIRFTVVRPIREASCFAETLASGDLTAKMPADRTDEIGELATALNSTSSQLRTIVGDLTGNAKELNQAAGLLTETANSQAAGAEETNVQANAVAAAGEEMAVNAKGMAGSAARINDFARTVASSVEEMSASIGEVSRNCTQETEIARRADQQARTTRDLMARLGESAKQIDNIVELIARIAQQTNLLALNATIEAASAGEAGRGFAVVAHEIKELARQSASATEDIRKQVSSIQKNTTDSTVAIDDVVKVIDQVNQIAINIASAVEEQSATTSEIARSLQNISTATGELTLNVNQAAEGSTEVSRNIQGVSAAASDSAKGAASITTSTHHLQQLAAALQKMVERFRC